MTWDMLVSPTRKYCSIRHMEYPEFQTGIFGRMESAQYVMKLKILLREIYIYYMASSASGQDESNPAL